MTQLGVYITSLFLVLQASVAENLERAFLRNDPAPLLRLFAPGQAINVSLPEPIAFSDQITREQTFFLFQGVFRTYRTFEFFLEPNGLHPVGGGRFILRARWSFLSQNKKQFVYQISFYIRGRPGATSPRDFWVVSEIKAENPERL